MKRGQHLIDDVHVGGEELRQILHIVLGTALILLFAFDVVGRVQLLFFLISFILLFLVYMIFRIPLLHQLMLYVERDQDMKIFPGMGAITFVTGIVVAVWVFPREIALAAMLIVTFGDSVSVLVGKYGKTPYINSRKNWEGLGAGMVAGTVTASFVVPVTVAAVAAVVSMLVEGLDLRIGQWEVDDNLFVPLLSGGIMLLLGLV
jgi:dolichol kinase